MKVAGICVAIGLVWIVGASRVTSHEKLTLAEIVPGAVMTQPFGCSNLLIEPFDPHCPSHHTHTGVDLAASEGTVVRAAAGGIAGIFFDPHGAGLYVMVALDSHVRVLYCHLSAATVTVGQRIETGQAIGLIGSTGLATGPHLHFEVQLDGVPIDPVVWLAS
jgi:murein DD-endopeptidase MepM/ murein hydrolase activator NlpD